MKIEVSQAKQYKIKVDGLDLICVYVENFEPGQGKIVIECFGDAWANYWGAMADRSLQEFFVQADVHYLAGKLSTERERELVYDYEALEGIMRKTIIEKRRDYEFTKERARELYDEIQFIQFDEGMMNDMSTGMVMDAVLGDDWYLDIPAGKNHHYEYLCRIINAVKEAFKYELENTDQ